MPNKTAGLKQNLNPIYQKLDKISDFSDIVKHELSELEKIEYPHLEQTLSIIIEQASGKIARLESLEKEMKDTMYMIENSTGDDKSEAISDYKSQLAKARIYIASINRLLSQVNSPYFGKINFKRQAENGYAERDIKAYIGKLACFDPDTRTPLVTDWRAPIANIYYRNSGPAKDVSFVAPRGKQIGDLAQKLQFDIGGGRFQEIYDVKTGNTSADAFLLNQLKQRVGKKLQDIVATIQQEQNSIIREETGHPVIIQGVAGSGKTTIILHRIAYLSYSQEDEIDPQKTLILAPNKMFLDYISDVLPSLGVEGISKNTYETWAKTILDWDKKYVLSNEEDNLKVKSFKGSHQFIKIFERFIEEFEQDVFDKMPDDPHKMTIEIRYFELKEEFPDIDMAERLDLAIGYGFAQDQFHHKTTGDFMGKLALNKRRMKKITDYVRKRLNVEKLYKSFFKLDHLFKDADVDNKFAKLVKNHTLKTFKSSGKFRYFKDEDLAPLVWLKTKLYGNKEYQNDYIIIDEAQDCSLFQLLTLFKCAKNNNITFAGDVAQSIIPPFYIDDWDQLIKLLDNYTNSDDISYHQLEKCYRTTAEIIDFANKIFKKKFPEGYKLPKSVLRHGDDVKIHMTSTEIAKLGKKNTQNELDSLIETINSDIEKGSASIGILCRDHKHASETFKLIKSQADQITRNVVSYTSNDFQDGVLVLPIDRAKGLEFDAVIIADVSAENYSDSYLDAKLLYVAITRALHRLHLTVPENSEISPLIESVVKNT
ncbi:AAA family ATPase [Candidatus Dojkabacteria bacterium]|nr:AAA family ATPase [Candidatus Dojkabacteria bacterium]